jgi:predicted  nucleic acid-binding Zn-ribbon protein
MSQKRKRKPNKAQRLKRQEERSQLEFQAVIEDTASTYTCSHAMTTDLLFQAEQAMEDLEGDVFFNQLALDIWRAHADKAPELFRALSDLVTEREKYRLALSSLRDRLEVLGDAQIHEHLEKEETYIELIRDRLMSIEGQSGESGDEPSRLSD